MTSDRFICTTRHGGNMVYDITYDKAPYTMQEIGRLREIAFRDAGGGTGKSIDIDAYDIMEKPFHQLLVWNPKEKEIISSYRYILGADIKVTNKNVGSPVAKLFQFSDEFINDYLPCSIELGRSFVQPKYQATRLGAFALDNIWDGLGAIICLNPHVKYFYGKMTMYKTYNQFARDLILYFLKKHFSSPTHLVQPVNPLPFHHDENRLAEILTSDDFNEDFKTLVKETQKLN
ncbi:MAG: GNAT family N-acetyltransferase, partial [Bacteroidales bacterium]|nr:GNAT family N-acetyltransferase [Bacteroidales bacterium]